MRIDAENVLCERCGYTISDLDPTGACPECGRPIEDSLPVRRAGSAWQRGLSPITLVLTGARTIRRPISRWDAVRVERERAGALTVTHCVLASAIAPGALVVPAPGRIGDGIAVGVLSAALATVVLLALCWVERVGIRSLSRLRRWRITRDVAHAIVGHASIGWVLGSFVGAAFFLGRWLSGAGSVSLIEIAVGVGVAFVVGLLSFEALVYAGLRRMKFANPPAEEENGRD